MSYSLAQPNSHRSAHIVLCAVSSPSIIKISNEYKDLFHYNSTHRPLNIYILKIVLHFKTHTNIILIEGEA